MRNGDLFFNDYLNYLYLIEEGNVTYFWEPPFGMDELVKDSASWRLSAYDGENLHTENSGRFKFICNIYEV